MERLIPFVNKIQDVFVSLGRSPVLELPQVVVVGAQSSGKSSVLEAIVGREFLPRGSGIVTRCPLVLQLRATKSAIATDVGSPPLREDGSAAEEWATFLHKPDTPFVDFLSVRDEISRTTKELAGDDEGKGISTRPIRLTIFSPYVVDLTLVDLPGVVKVPVGAQPKNIAAQVRRMILQYIAPENTIILAITPANTDIANSDAVQIAREVDPKGDRTVGVLTKLDIMDRGTDAVNVLDGSVLPLRLGYVGVVNRSQHDIHVGTSIREALAAEAKFFQRHPRYAGFASRMGTAYLAKRLSQLLAERIRQALPELEATVLELTQKTAAELRELDAALGANGMNEGGRVLHAIADFTRHFYDHIYGGADVCATSELVTGARIHHAFAHVFGETIDQVSVTDELSDDTIKAAIRSAMGTRGLLYVPEGAFDLLVRAQIKRLRLPCEQCVHVIHDELRRNLKSSLGVLQRHPRLQNRVEEVVGRLLLRLVGPTEEMVRGLVDIELGYINTTHPDFVSGSSMLSSSSDARVPDHDKDGGQHSASAAARRKSASSSSDKRHAVSAPDIDDGKEKSEREGFLQSFFGGRSRESKKKGSSSRADVDGHQQAHASLPVAPNRDQQSVPQERRTGVSKETMEVAALRQMLASYVNIVKKNVKDNVIKAIMTLLVQRTCEQMHNELVAQLYNPELFPILLEADADTRNRRTAAEELLDGLERAGALLAEARSFHLDDHET